MWSGSIFTAILYHCLDLSALANPSYPSHAKGDVPTCHTFHPSPRANWNFIATTSSIRLSHTLNCNIYHVGPCRTAPEEPSQTLTWRLHWDATENANADIRDFNLSAILGAPYAEEVSTEMEGVEMWVPIGMSGYMSVGTRAVEVQGTFADCGDGKQYNGRMVVPSTEGVTYTLTLVTPP